VFSVFGSIFAWGTSIEDHKEVVAFNSYPKYVRVTYMRDKILFILCFVHARMREIAARD
jgi:hypothetical protein